MSSSMHLDHPAAKSGQPVVIKKYRNRRLYNASIGAYVTLDTLAGLVKQGEEIIAYDLSTGADITRSVLAQIVLEQENKEGPSLLPIAFLRQLIRFYGSSVQMLVPCYLEISIESLARERKKVRRQMLELFDAGVFGPLEEQARCNIEMLEHIFSIFTLFASGRGGSVGEDK
jgi:polyhydroxyalkanoate synthesis repressor PhaR